MRCLADHPGCIVAVNITVTIRPHGIRPWKAFVANVFWRYLRSIIECHVYASATCCRIPVAKKALVMRNAVATGFCGFAALRNGASEVLTCFARMLLAKV